MGPFAEEPTTKEKFTYDQVQQEVKNGRGLLIYDAKVYDVTHWMKAHPGGELVIWHMLGRDATDQILTNHTPEILEKYMKIYYVGKIDKTDAKTATMVDRPLSLAFRRLHQKVTDAGLFRTNPWFYVKLYSSISTWGILALLFLYLFPSDIIGLTISAFFLALFWHQSAGIMHDTGHNGITQNRLTDNYVGFLCCNVFTGLSIGWWKTTHFVHHLVTNNPDHDPHIQMLPFVAIATRFFDSVYSTYHRRVIPFDKFAHTMVQYQHFVYIPLMALARFVMYKDSFVYIARKERFWKIELFSIMLFWAYFLGMILYIPDPRLQFYYFMLPNMLLVVLLLQLYVSHNHMSVEPMKQDEEYAAYQVRTTMDFWCKEEFDWVNGGLQFQTAHHFFPRMPRHNLRKATDFVVEFCKENNLPYTMMGFVEGNVKLLKHLREIAEEAKHYKPTS